MLASPSAIEPNRLKLSNVAAMATARWSFLALNTLLDMFGMSLFPSISFEEKISPGFPVHLELTVSLLI
jgi:hypothetical protein